MSALIDDYQRTQYVRTSLPIADTAASLRSFKYNLNVAKLAQTKLKCHCSTDTSTHYVERYMKT
jgi:hypothetical protein